MVVICKLNDVFEGMHPLFSTFRDLYHLLRISSLVVIKRPQNVHVYFYPYLFMPMHLHYTVC